jgi:hypothetical protein
VQKTVEKMRDWYGQPALRITGSSRVPATRPSIQNWKGVVARGLERKGRVALAFKAAAFDPRSQMR